MLKAYRNKKFVFGTKSQTLEALSGLLQYSAIPQLVRISEKDWHEKADLILDHIEEKFQGKQVAVRSSAGCEDQEAESKAGQFGTVLGLDSTNRQSLSDAVDEVFASYAKGEFRIRQNEEVFVQEYITDSILSGVIFTQDLNTGAPYYVINYDDISGRTDSVTAGNHLSYSLYVYRNSFEMIHSPRWQAVLTAVMEIEDITSENQLDIEFALQKDNTVQIFQVRRITTQPNWNRGITIQIEDSLRRIRGFIENRMQPLPGIYGSQPVYGQMPDWNPAEMIGLAPRQLAASLYSELITNQTWRKARSLMGYSEPKGQPLMVFFGGQPFIDVRLSFHSFIPASLPETTAQKLVDAWIERLKDAPELHDKVEFDVAITALTFDFESRFQKQMSDAGLTEEEYNCFKDCLSDLTNRFVSGEVCPIDEHIGYIERLEDIRSQAEQHYNEYDLTTVRYLVESCLEYGTLPFSILARHGFIANSFLLSMVTAGVFTEDELQAFMESIETVAGQLIRDTQLFGTGGLSEEEFLKQYGHLRPGTYDIQTSRYDQNPEYICRTGTAVEKASHTTVIEKTFSLTPLQNKQIKALLERYGFKVSVDDFVQYMKDAIRAREYAKFMFTRCISDILEYIADWGKQKGLSREELSYISLHDILDTDIKTNGRDLEETLRKISQKNQADYKVTQALKLPMLIQEINDIYIVPIRISKPNYITQKAIESKVICLSDDIEKNKLRDAIVVVEQADPGYDWMFTYGISGLITMFGGANSHMAIRCAELGIPAAIGCGPIIFEQVSSAKRIRLDCESHRIIPLAN